ncbi:Ig-like domain-containing protein [Methylobacterium sp. 37f]|uniref:Ig-like domain-containing protein n=1 Tax=Methylobacterium sp. 37f TaxID=2817058 RepID=UPI001FFDDA10|nr:Ig-like domain-containing protein [Methylobacterium sp. 37f]MCK2055323.1 hypothetical protein [Methylobacterium sp. 37f]
MPIVPSTAVSSYNDRSSDANFQNNVPLLNKNSSVTGSLRGSVNFSSSPDGADTFVFDIVGGTQDSVGSLMPTDKVYLNYQLDSPGTITLSYGQEEYTYENSGLGGTQSLSFTESISGSGSVMLRKTINPNMVFNDVLELLISSTPGTGNGNGYHGNYTLTFSTSPSGGGDPDVLAPTAALSVNDRHLTAGETASLTFQFSEAVTGFAATDLTATGGSVSNFATVDADTYTALFTPAINFNSQGRVSFAEGSYADAAGNAGSAGEVTFSVNTVTPGGTTVVADGVHRFFNTNTGGHFFTISDGEAAQVQATRSDLRPEGTGFGGFATDQGAATEEVYRFFNTKTGGHFFTTSEGERDQVIATNRDYKLEGIGFYDFTADQGAATEEVYRFFNTKTGGHFFTASEGERDQVIATNQTYKFEGIAFYAPEDGATLVL